MLSAAELVRQALAAVLDRLASARRGRSKSSEVTGRRRPLDREQRPEAAAERVELLVDVLVGHLGGGDGDLEPVVRGQLELGDDVGLGGELQAARRR